MLLKQLETFLNVAELKSFTKTAEHLFLSQPTVSIHISALEQELNTQLIIRSAKGVTLTQAGKVLYRHARQMITIKEQALQEIQNQFTQGAVSIAASSIPGQYFLPGLMSRFSGIHPQVTFLVETTDSQQAIEMLLAHQADLAMTGTVIASSQCVYTPFASDRLVLIAPNNAPYSCLAHQENSLEELLKMPFITRKQGSGTRMEAEAILREMGHDPSGLNVVAELQDAESIKNSVAMGLGVAIVSECAVGDYVRFRKVFSVPLGSDANIRPLYLVRSNHTLLSGPANEFHSFILKQITLDATAKAKIAI